MKLSLRDKISSKPDIWNPETGVTKQDRSSRIPSLQEFQMGLNKAKDTVIKEESMSENRIMKTLRDSAGNIFKQIFENNKKIYDSRQSHNIAFIKERGRRINAAISKLKVKASKDEWLAAREKLIQKLMDKTGRDYEEIENYLDTPEGFKVMEDYSADYTGDRIDYLHTMNGI